jgi:uncharacterized protein
MMKYFNIEQFGVDHDEVTGWIERRGVKHLLLVVTGSHMWNTARPTSDLDIRGIYIQPTRDILGLYPPKDTIEAADLFDGQVDLQLYEIKKVMEMLLNGNGNIVEMLLSPTCFYEHPDAWIDWQNIARQFLTKRLYHYYKGYYHSQRQRAARNRGSKALVYSARELMAGTVLMETGEIIYDLWELREVYEGLYGKLPLLDEYSDRSNWNTPVSNEKLIEFEAMWEGMAVTMQKACNRSELPERDPGHVLPLLNHLLLEIRNSN